MSLSSKLVRIPSLKTVGEFRRHLAASGLGVPCDEAIHAGLGSELNQSAAGVRVGGKEIGNRWAVQPMEGWDGTPTGGVTEAMVRRWRRFGESGAKLICGGEAMAVHPDGRANPNQLILNAENLPGIASLRESLVEAHRERFGGVGDLVIGFQLTHSGRFCRPRDKRQLAPRVAYRHPLLDSRFGVTSDAAILSDAEVEELIGHFVTAARFAREAGADFVDIKHCHGYLLHEFLGAFTRPGRYGGSFENRTRILREIVAGIRASRNPIDIAVRLSAFDFVPFRPDPAQSRPGRPGAGIPEDFAGLLPYRFAFGVNLENPVEPDLTETFQFADLCVELGVKILNLSAGSPYYNPHIQRPAAYPPSDGYQPPEDPLVGVARQMEAVRRVKAHLAARTPFEGSAVADSTKTSLHAEPWNPATHPHERQHLLSPSLSSIPNGGEGAQSAEERAGRGVVGKSPEEKSPIVHQSHCTAPLIVGSAYSYLQEYLPHVAQAAVREGWVDIVGIGRMVLSYPEIFSDAVQTGALAVKKICRTFSDCTTAPRNGLPSGCYPLDPYYTAKEESQQLKEIKRGNTGNP